MIDGGDDDLFVAAGQALTDVLLRHIESYEFDVLIADAVTIVAEGRVDAFQTSGTDYLY